MVGESKSLDLAQSICPVSIGYGVRDDPVSRYLGDLVVRARSGERNEVSSAIAGDAVVEFIDPNSTVVLALKINILEIPRVMGVRPGGIEGE